MINLRNAPRIQHSPLSHSRTKANDQSFSPSSSPKRQQQKQQQSGHNKGSVQTLTISSGRDDNSDVSDFDDDNVEERPRSTLKIDTNQFLRGNSGPATESKTPHTNRTALSSVLSVPSAVDPFSPSLKKKIERKTKEARTTAEIATSNAAHIHTTSNSTHTTVQTKTKRSTNNVLRNSGESDIVPRSGAPAPTTSNASVVSGASNKTSKSKYSQLTSGTQKPGDANTTKALLRASSALAKLKDMNLIPIGAGSGGGANVGAGGVNPLRKIDKIIQEEEEIRSKLSGALTGANSSQKSKTNAATSSSEPKSIFNSPLEKSPWIDNEYSVPLVNTTKTIEKQFNQINEKLDQPDDITVTTIHTTQSDHQYALQEILKTRHSGYRYEKLTNAYYLDNYELSHLVASNFKPTTNQAKKYGVSSKKQPISAILTEEEKELIEFSNPSIELHLFHRVAPSSSSSTKATKAMNARYRFNQQLGIHGSLTTGSTSSSPSTGSSKSVAASFELNYDDFFPALAQSDYRYQDIDIANSIIGETRSEVKRFERERVIGMRETGFGASFGSGHSLTIL